MHMALHTCLSFGGAAIGTSMTSMLISAQADGWYSLLWDFALGFVLFCIIFPRQGVQRNSMMIHQL